MVSLEQRLLFVLVAAAVAFAVWGIWQLASNGDRDRLRNRLTDDQPDSFTTATEGHASFTDLIQRVGMAAARPFMPKDKSKEGVLRRDLIRAGVYSPTAARTVIGGRVVLLCVGFFGGLFVGELAGQALLGLSLGGIVGYMAPTLWLKSRIGQNQRELTLGLPDALDLMVVCVEAGLTIEAAMQRVGDELSLAHPAISREVGICHMETRIGLPRREALRNLGERTGNLSLQQLAAMLSQADRFGTGIAGALRVQAESLRIKRQQSAEGLAAKASVKLSFPLVLFIMPAAFIVMIGPAVMNFFS